MPVLSRTKKSWLHFLEERVLICQKNICKCKYFLEHIFLDSTDSFFSRRHVPQLSKRQSRYKYFLEDRFLNCKKDRADESTFKKTQSSTVKTTEQMPILSKRQIFYLAAHRADASTFQNTYSWTDSSRRHAPQLSKRQKDESTFQKTDSSTVKNIEQMKVLSRRQIPRL